MKGMITICLLLLVESARAGQVEIVKVKLQQQGGSWSADVTLRHKDTGWDHYADGWRVVSPDGKVLGHRTLYHPHINEQPFTRSLSGIDIPSSLKDIVVEAHDKVHGWSPDQVTIDLSRNAGERYRIDRQ